MKSKAYIILSTCILLAWSCSGDDDANNQTPPTISELLVSHGAWSFKAFKVLEIRDSGTSTASSQDIEEGLEDEFEGTTLEFNSDLSGTLANPQSQVPFTWQLNSDDDLILTPSSGDPINFDQISLTESELALNTETTFYDAAADTDVVAYGTFFFD